MILLYNHLFNERPLTCRDGLRKMRQVGRRLTGRGLGGTREERPRGWELDGLYLVTTGLKSLICREEIIRDTSKNHCEAEDKCLHKSSQDSGYGKHSKVHYLSAHVIYTYQ